jgi:hypothetical protein
LAAAEDAMTKDSSKYLEFVEDIRQDHIQAAKEFILDGELRNELIELLNVECDKLCSFLKAAQVRWWV